MIIKIYFFFNFKFSLKIVYLDVVHDHVVEGVVDQVVHFVVGFSVQVGQVVDLVVGIVPIGLVGCGFPSSASLWAVIVGGSGVIGSKGFSQFSSAGADVKRRPKERKLLLLLQVMICITKIEADLKLDLGFSTEGRIPCSSG